MLKAVRLSVLAVATVLTAGCMNVSYAVDQSSAPVEFSSSPRGDVVRAVSKDNRNYFVVLGLLTVNDMVPSLGNGLGDVGKLGENGQTVVITGVQEQMSVIDWAISFVAGFIPYVGVLYDGSRTSTVQAVVETSKK